MGERLENIAKELVDSEKSVHLIYAFNGTGKTRLSKMVKEEVKKDSETKTRDKILIIMLLRRIYFIGIMIWEQILISN